MGRAIKAIGILFFIAIVVAGKPYKTAASYEHTSGQKAPASISLKHDSASQDHAQGSQNDPPHWYTALKRPEWWLVLVGFFTFFAIGYQAWETAKAVKEMGKEANLLRESVSIARTSAEAAKTSARAAKDSADALVDMERAWLVVDMNGFDNPQELLNEFRRAGRTVQLAVPFTNCGRTPAWVVEWSRRAVVTNSAIIQSLDYEVSDTSPEGSPFPPGKHERSMCFLFDWTIQDRSEIDNIEQGRVHLYVYGFVKYRDIFNKMRETYFCLRYFRNTTVPGREEIGWRVDGPPEANRHT